MRLALEIWLPLGALLISSGAFGFCILMAWLLAPEGQKLHARWAWAAHWGVVGMAASLVLLVLGAWWWARPF